jgi:hypothetical protein
MQSMVVTTINSPTDVFRIFTEELKIRGIAVGDVKTPDAWQYPGVDFLSIDIQKKLNYRIVSHLPYGHYSRKNIGYIFAKKNEASSIVDTDDDNFPIPSWKYPVEKGPFFVVNEKQGFLNVYEFYSSSNSANFWPRGYPLDEIIPTKGHLLTSGIVRDTIEGRVGIWQGLVNGDPDLDALYRLTHKEVTYKFSDHYPVLMGKGCYCPINSQNTVFIKDLFALLYLPSTVSFRYTDILRGYIAQIIACHKGYKIGFTSATAFQVRNAHNLMADFEDEIQMHLNCKKVIEIAESTVRDSENVEDNLHQIYKGLTKAKIVSTIELDTLDAFLQDMS